MGFVVWAALTALAFAAGWAVALRAGARLPLGEQLVAACVTAVALVLAPILVLGFADALHAWALGPAVALLGVGSIALARPERADLRALRVRLEAAARASVANPVGAVLTAAALLLVVYLAAYVYLLPSWGWDAMSYHDVATAYAFQSHSLRWFDTPGDSALVLASSYPKNIELLALWNGIFAPDDRLIDAAQLPLVLMAVVAIAAMCRRAGAAAPLAWGLGLCWLFMPAVFLNTPSDYVDAGAASLAIAAVLFLARLDAGPAERLFGALALGEAVGSKVSGALLAVLLVPVVLGAAWLAWRRRPGLTVRRVLEVAAMAAAVLAFGGYSYVRDWLRFGNPVWPVRAHIPLTHATFPGIWDMRLLDTPPFGGPDGWAAMFRSFLDAKPFYIVDVRTGGFGPLWLYVLLPCFGLAMLWAAYRALRRQATPALLASAVLIVHAAATPARWWPRYTLGFPAGGLIALAVLVAAWLEGRARVQLGLLGAVGAAAMVQAWPARVGFFAPLDVLAAAVHLTPQERATQRFDTWQQKDIGIRDRVVQPGEASIYDDSVSFVYQLWRSDWKNRVLYLPLERDRDPNAWLDHLVRENARWAAIQRGSLAEQVLSSAGWKMLYPCGSEGCAVWVRPGTAIPSVPVFDYKR